jgi:hypothetical protein
MSHDVLSIIPRDPKFVPAVDVQQVAQNRISELLINCGEIQIAIYDNVRFIDQGENFEDVTCPKCSSSVVDWWSGAMESAFQNQFEDLTVVMPCCSQELSLNELNYNWPAGFAKFALRINNPNISHNLSDDQMHELENILGCQLRQVRAHY